VNRKINTEVKLLLCLKGNRDGVVFGRLDLHFTIIVILFRAHSLTDYAFSSSTEMSLNCLNRGMPNTLAINAYFTTALKSET
jgi:hypothetical protein